MAVLSLLIDARGRSALHRAGFSWLAALSLPLWALHRRFWIGALALLPLSLAAHALANTAIEAVTADVDHQGLLALAWLLAQSLAAGAFANRLHAAWLAWRGYRLTATEARP